MKTVKIEIIDSKVLPILESLEDLGLINIAQKPSSKKYSEIKRETTASVRENATQYGVSEKELKDWLKDIRERFSDFTQEDLDAEIAEARHGNAG